MLHDEVNTIDQTAGDLDDGLTWLHGSAVFDIGGRKDRVLTRSYPRGLDNKPAQLGVPPNGDIACSIVLTT